MASDSDSGGSPTPAAKPRRFRCEVTTYGRSQVTFDVPAYVPDSEIPDDPEVYHEFVVALSRGHTLDFVSEEEIERGFNSVEAVEAVTVSEPAIERPVPAALSVDAKGRLTVCANCDHSLWVDSDRSEQGKIECRRFPPTRAWPLVLPHDWCGEWRLDRDMAKRMRGEVQRG